MIPGRPALVGLLLAGAVAADAEPQYLVDMDLWLEGVRQESPAMVVTPSQPASIETEQGGRAWRVVVEIENQPTVGGDTALDVVWLYVEVLQRRDGEWESMADSILGVAEGRSATLSVVEEQDEPPAPENSTVYLTTSTSRLRPADGSR